MLVAAGSRLVARPAYSAPHRLAITQLRIASTDFALHVEPKRLHPAAAAANRFTPQNNTNGHGGKKRDHDKECEYNGRHYRSIKYGFIASL